MNYTVIAHAYKDPTQNKPKHGLKGWRFNRAVKDDGGRWNVEIVSPSGEQKYFFFDPKNMPYSTITTGNLFKEFKKVLFTQKINISEDELWKVVNTFWRLHQKEIVSGAATMGSFKHSDDVIDVSEEYLEHREVNTYEKPHAGFGGYSVNHEGYYSPNLDPKIDFRWQGCQLEEQQRTNPVVWFQFLSNKENFKPDGSGSPMTNCTLSFVSDPRMLKSNSLIKQQISGKVKQWCDSRKIKYTLHETELNKCASAVHKLLKAYQQTHPEFVDHLNTSGNRKPSLSNVLGHSAYSVVPSGESELYHHGVLGMKWGVRRYQNADGSLTEEGRQHYGNTSRRSEANDINKKLAIAKYGHDAAALQKEAAKALKKGNTAQAEEYNKLQIQNRDKQKQLRRDFADKRVEEYGKKTAVAGELLKGVLRSYGINLAGATLSAVTGTLGALPGFVIGGPVGAAVGYFCGASVMSIPVSALNLQSGYATTRNIVDIADSNKISKEKKYR